MKPPVQCTEQQESPFNIPKYCACHEKVTVQHHEMLRLPRTVTLRIVTQTT